MTCNLVEIRNVLTKNDCLSIISTFNNDKGKEKGKTGYGVSINKNSVDLEITNKELWGELLVTIDNAIENSINKYIENPSNPLKFLLSSGRFSITKPQIQHYKKGDGFFDWHLDSIFGDNRVLAVILYLNNVLDGGETEFFDGKKILPEHGKILLFPPFWTHVHCGHSPISEDKYIITCFLEYSKTS